MPPPPLLLRWDVTMELSVPGQGSRTITREVQAPTLEDAVNVAKIDLLIVVLKSVALHP
jgi:hypothetical protein